MKIQVCYTKNCEKYVKLVCDAVAEHYRLKCFMNTLLELISPAYNAERRQYDAAFLLDYLVRFKAADAAIWLVDRDIYCGDMNYVFGYAAQNYGAVLSTYRLRRDELVVKEALHEVGHVLGLRHCSNRCLMRFSDSVEDAALKPYRLCERCRNLINIY